MRHRLATYTTAGAALVMSPYATAQQANGYITFSPLAASSVSIPTLSGTLLVVLSALLGLVALYMLKKHTSNNFPMAVVLLLTGATVSGAGGFGIISQADAGQTPTYEEFIDSRNGKSFDLEEGINRFVNRSGVSMIVADYGTGMNVCRDVVDEFDTCDVGLVLNNNQSCSIECGGQ